MRRRKVRADALGSLPGGCAWFSPASILVSFVAIQEVPGRKPHPVGSAVGIVCRPLPLGDVKVADEVEPARIHEVHRIVPGIRVQVQPAAIPMGSSEMKRCSCGSYQRALL